MGCAGWPPSQYVVLAGLRQLRCWQWDLWLAFVNQKHSNSWAMGRVMESQVTPRDSCLVFDHQGGRHNKVQHSLAGQAQDQASPRSLTDRGWGQPSGHWGNVPGRGKGGSTWPKGLHGGRGQPRIHSPAGSSGSHLLPKPLTQQVSHWWPVAGSRPELPAKSQAVSVQIVKLP